jgi:hypothetical protein
MKRVAVLLLLLCMGQAHASQNGQTASGGSKWKAECSSCHLAYPPQLLASENWQQLMSRMDQHFGTNAVLDARDNKEILSYLKSNSGSEARYRSASLRISDTPWFRRKHRNVSDKEWVHPDVKSRSNCTACHVDPAARLGMGN